jgi:hypothetical protein
MYGALDRCLFSTETESNSALAPCDEAIN